MLKLKSVVKSREQLLATGWVERLHGSFEHPSVEVNLDPIMCKGIYNGVVNEEIHTRLISHEGCSEYWFITPEMVLLVDQWGFVRDPETLDILMWDAIRGGASAIQEIYSGGGDYPILARPLKWEEGNGYTKAGLYYIRHTSALLSKYPYSLQYGGYTPFDFEELKEAFKCPKVVEGNDNTSSVNDATPETVTTYEQDGYKYTVSRIKI